MNTMIKFGSLALDVAQDEKIRELMTMLHHGAKRRGLFSPEPLYGPSPASGTQTNSIRKPVVNHPIPFAPNGKATSAIPAPSGIPFNKYLTIDNAKKVMSMAGAMSHLLVK